MKYLLYSCLYPALMIFSSLATDLESKEKTICLNMIVKNETQVLERCLNSTKSLIDYWVIVDTGSTDGTQQLIRDCLKDIPGELYERPWVNFEYNRNEALQLAQGKADYALFLDADERLIVSEDFISCPPLELDYYFSAFRETTDPLGFFKVLLVNLHKDWSWVGVLHETLQSSNAKTSDVLPGITCLRDTPSSARSQDPQKYQKDVKVLEEALAKDPYNSRHVFYLAQSYANSKDYPSALKNYQKRVAMQGGDPEEIFWSLFMIARLQEALNHPFAVVLHSYDLACQYRPTRAEPFFYLSEYLIKHTLIPPAYTLSKLAMTFSCPLSRGYIEPFIYDYGSLYLTACTAYELRHYQEALSLFQELSQKKGLPQKIEEAIQKSLAGCLGQ